MCTHRFLRSAKQQPFQAQPMTQATASAARAGTFVWKDYFVFYGTASWRETLLRIVRIFFLSHVGIERPQNSRLFLTKATEASPMNNRQIKSAETDSVTVVRDVTGCRAILTDFVTLTESDPRWRPRPGRPIHNSLNYNYYVINTKHYCVILFYICCRQNSAEHFHWYRWTVFCKKCVFTAL